MDEIVKIVLSKDGIIINGIAHLIGEAIAWITRVEGQLSKLVRFYVDPENGHVMIEIEIQHKTFVGQILAALSHNLFTFDLTELLGGKVSVIDGSLVITTAEVLYQLDTAGIVTLPSEDAPTQA